MFRLSKKTLQVCITNRKLVYGDFLKRIKAVCESGVDAIILREKDMDEDDYEELAKQVISICDSYGVLCILHSFIEIATYLKHPHIHLTMDGMKNASKEVLNTFETIGVSTHTEDDIIEAIKYNVSYVTLSPIFETECKKGVVPIGTEFLKDMTEKYDIPILALGGIHPDNIAACVYSGAKGVCMMSEYMNDDDEELE